MVKKPWPKWTVEMEGAVGARTTKVSLTNKSDHDKLPPLLLWSGAPMRGDLQPIVIYVVEGSGMRDMGWRRGEDGSEV